MMQKQGYPEKNYLVPTKRYCQTLRLKDNPGLIAEYRKIHSRMEAWPEIRAGIRSVGILEMEMYISGSQVFMIVETPMDFDWDKAMEQLFPFASPVRMGRLCSPFPGMCTGKHVISKVETDGADVLFV